MDHLIASAYPEATIFSIGPYDETADRFIQESDRLHVKNAWRMISGINKNIATEWKASPELVRYQFIHPHTVLEGTSQRPALHINVTEALLPIALTSFILLPSPELLSIAYTMFFLDPACMAPMPIRESVDEEAFYGRDLSLYAISSHPMKLMKQYQKEWISMILKKGMTYEVICDELCLIRVDIRNLTRNVNHHFQSILDGHKRKYQMRIETVNYLNKIYSLPEEESSLPPLPAYYHYNNKQYTAVYLIREKDDTQIPYEHIYGITLITALRMTLHIQQRKTAYSLFLKLPLYEDMAPWNILLTGSELTYIDYDTKTETFDQDIVKVYRILEVLMNFKRTIGDFNMCGDRAGNPVYNFDVISECVQSLFKGPCSDTRYPIACGDGTCKSDYVSCLRDIDRKAEEGELHGRYMIPMRLHLRK